MDERTFQNLHEEIDTLIESKNYRELTQILKVAYPVDIAEAFEGLTEKKINITYRLLPKETAAEVFVDMDPDMQQMLITGFNDTELREIIDELYVDDAVDIIEEMPATVVSRILKTTDSQTRKLINEILLYPDDSAGSVMTTEYVALKESMTVDQAFDHIRSVGVDSETIYTCYITNNRKLVGSISIRTLLIADKDARVSDLMNDNVIWVNTYDDKEFVASQIKKYDLLAIPVVDAEDRLVGIVTVDDAIDVLEEEATEDMQIMAAVTPIEKPYIKASTFETWKQRIPWLLLLMVSATFTGMIISSFESALAAYAALTAFIPMIMDTGGNSGSQASVTVIRSLALGEVEPKDVLKVLWKEVRVGVFCGLTLGIANFAKIFIVEMLLLKTLPMDQNGFRIALVVCITLCITVICAKLIGCSLPLLAKRLKLDPAVMASPFITTAVDAISLLLYFQIATALLHI